MLIRAWLRGTAKPTSTTAQQWREILAPERESITSPESRTNSWSKIVDATANSHEKFRELAKSAVSLSLGAKEIGIVDAGAVAKAIVSLRETMTLSEVPNAVADTPNWMADLALLANIARRIQGLLPDICDSEARLLHDRAQRIMEMLRGRTIRAHADRTTSALDSVIRVLPNASPVAVDKWVQSSIRLPDKKVTTPLEMWLANNTEKNLTKPNDAAKYLDELCQAPAGELNLISSILSDGEKAVETVLQFAEAFVDQDGHAGASIETVHQTGTKILLAVKETKTATSPL
jgi:hypothetical protein